MSAPVVLEPTSSRDYIELEDLHGARNYEGRSLGGRTSHYDSTPERTATGTAATAIASSVRRRRGLRRSKRRSEPR
jgi:hypothetical protein